jgi:large subunit ribosomal protein L4
LFKGGGTVLTKTKKLFIQIECLKRLARKSARSAKESNIIVLEDFNFETQTLKISSMF